MHNISCCCCCFYLWAITDYYFKVGQSPNPGPTFIDQPSSSIKGEINTTINLFWRIQYDTCTGGSSGCFRVSIDTPSRRLYQSPVDVRNRIEDFLYDAITAISGGPNGTSYANVRFIMFIDEYVLENVLYVMCEATLEGGDPPQDQSTVHIVATDQTVSATAISLPSDSMTLSAKPPSLMQVPDLICSSACVPCCSILYFKLLCFFQGVYLIVLYN